MTYSRIVFLKRDPTFTLLKQMQQVVAKPLQLYKRTSTATIHDQHCRQVHAHVPNASIFELAIVHVENAAHVH